MAQINSVDEKNNHLDRNFQGLIGFKVKLQEAQQTKSIEIRLKPQFAKY